VRNARQYMPDLACFNYLLTHSFNPERQLAFNEIGELVTVRVDMTRQCLAGRPIGSSKQYFLSGNAFQVSTKNGASPRSSKLRIDCSRSCNPTMMPAAIKEVASSNDGFSFLPPWLDLRTYSIAKVQVGNSRSFVAVGAKRTPKRLWVTP
jgi:hypothetical protein